MLILGNTNQLALRAGATTGSTGLTVTGNFSDLSPPQLDTALEPGIPVDPGLPYVPASTLPKLPTQQSNNILLSLEGTTFLIGTNDYSEAFVDGDIYYPLSGETRGTVTLDTVPGLPGSLNPRANSELRPGTRILWSNPLYGVPVTMLEGYIIEPPTYTNGVLTLAIGDILALKAQDDGLYQSPYCGRTPRFARGWAKLYARTRNIPVNGFPRGNEILGGIVNNFREESPSQFYNDLYEPSGNVVYTSPRGILRVEDYPEFNEAEAIALSAQEAIENRFDSPQVLPFSTISVVAEYSRNLGFEEETRTYESFSGNYNPADTRPWFISGSLRTETTVNLIAGQEVRRVTEAFGYIPDSTVIPNSLLSDNPCGGTSVATNEGRVYTDNWELYYEDHKSGAKLVLGFREWREGLDTYKDSGADTTVVFTGLLRDEITLYQNKSLKDNRVCSKNWILIQQNTQRATFERVQLVPDTEPELILTVSERDLWRRETGAATEQGEARGWIGIFDALAYQESTGLVVTQPQRRIPGNPPNSQFIRPKIVDIRLERTVSNQALINEFGVRKAPPVVVAYAYTPDQLRTWGNNYLRRQAGDAYAIMLTLNPRIRVQRGDSVIYTDEDGFQYRGIVSSVEYNQTGAVLSQSILLRRIF